MAQQDTAAADYHVGQAAVLGAGVMGAQIAAHLANCGIPVWLFELPAEGDDPRAHARRAIRKLGAQRPAPLAAPEQAQLIHPASYDTDLHRLVHCELVIEAVAERLDIKRELYARIGPHLPVHALVGSNTSGLSVNALAQVLPEPMQARFCGVHFFNPPRYMPLVELVPQAATDPATLDRLETFLTRRLGKNVVRAKDTPNFVGNRIGVFSIMAAIHHADRLGIPFDVVDALTGPAIGRPKSATFRTADLVGLDTLKHVVEGSAERLRDDPWQGYLRLPEWMNHLLEQGALGQKSGAGVYRKDKSGIQVLDPAQGDYRPSDASPGDEVAGLLKEKDPGRRLAGLRASDAPQAQFLWAIQRDLFHYAAYWLDTIADNVRDVDLALRWGFGWQEGPFEIWQSAGWADVARWIGEDIAQGEAMASVPLPDWVARLDQAHSPDGAYAPADDAWRGRSSLPVYRRQRIPLTLRGEPPPDFGRAVLETPGVRLWSLEDDIGILSFRTRRHAVGREVLDGVMEAVDAAETRFQALVLWQGSEPFSIGADLKQVTTALEAGDYATLERMVEAFQQATGRLRHSRLPVVAGVRGMALGGGCEFVLHCDRVVATQETYIGLVEAGVGLIPAGGGCKELARRAAAAAPDGDPFPALRNHFETVAKARVGGSALEGRSLGLLGEHSLVIAHSAEVLHVALAQARALAEGNYRPAVPGPVTVAGREGVANLRAMLANMREGGFISEHDRRVADAAAVALCGGEVDSASRVSEDWLLRLERDGFMELLRRPETQQRIEHMLRTGKPLRN